MTETGKVALTLACPTCPAKPGEPCTYISTSGYAEYKIGDPTKAPHAKRLRAAKKRLGLRVKRQSRAEKEWAAEHLGALAGKVAGLEQRIAQLEALAASRPSEPSHPAPVSPALDTPENRALYRWLARYGDILWT